jgi:hypothetical protein
MCLFSTFGAGGSCYPEAFDHPPFRPQPANYANPYPSYEWGWHPRLTHINPYPVNARPGGNRWCYTNNEVVDCSQPSFEMCLFSTFGAGGHCYLEASDRPPFREQPAHYANPYPSYQWGWRTQPTYMIPYPVNARPGGNRWCYTNNDVVDCSQPSFEMCLFSTFGAGGSCYPEEAYPSRLRAAVLHRHRLVARIDKPGVVASSADATRKAEQAFAAVTPDSGKPSSQPSAPTITLADATATDAPLMVSPARAAIAPASPRDLPKYNVEAACRRAAAIGPDGARDTAICLQDENEARDQLIRKWSSFSAGDRASCARMTGSSGGGTYTELVTCLEMNSFARGGGKNAASTIVVSR